MKTIVALTVAAAAALAGCAQVERRDAAYARTLELGAGRTITVVSDDVAGVTCWVSWTGTSCMPDRLIKGDPK